MTATSPVLMPDLHGPLVVVLVHDRLCTFEFSIVAEIFGLSRPEMGANWYRYASAGIEPGPFAAHGGLLVMPTAGMELLEHADLIVAAGWKGVDVPVPDELVVALRRASQRGARLASICSGAFVLAATGLLSGKRATTHWRYAETLRAMYPDIDVDADVLYVAEQRIYTSAGSAAGIDLMLHIVRDDFGVEVANGVARRLVMPLHRSGGQAQFIERPIPVDHQHRIAVLQNQVRADLASDWTTDRMAASAAMSSRTFLRRFIESTGLSPSQWLIAERIAEAQRLLESSSLSIERISALVGFGSVQTLRHHFQTKLSLSPSQYRNQLAAVRE